MAETISAQLGGKMYKKQSLVMSLVVIGLFATQDKWVGELFWSCQRENIDFYSDFD